MFELEKMNTRFDATSFQHACQRQLIKTLGLPVKPKSHRHSYPYFKILKRIAIRSCGYPRRKDVTRRSSSESHSLKRRSYEDFDNIIQHKRGVNVYSV